VSAINFRYIVDDVDAAIDFYTKQLGFTLDMHPAPPFAALSRDGVRLYVNAPGGPGGAGQAMPDGRVPEPGGWNRIQLEVEDLDAQVERLRTAGVRFRSDVIQGIGGRQVIVDDPAGNPVEILEPGNRA
jgi:catechol 2,3-dioxygenase-like lactoylglutathione lyase family enzyme